MVHAESAAREMPNSLKEPSKLWAQLAEYDETSKSIVAFIHHFGAASPGEIQSRLSLSKGTAYRRVRELLAAGMLIQSGKTAAVRYRLPPEMTKCGPSGPNTSRGRKAEIACEIV